MKEHNGCEGCVYVEKAENEEPCIRCDSNYMNDEKPDFCQDMWSDEKPDNVNHPSHYCQEGSMECIDEMVALFGKKVVQDFCLCNVWKYRKRAIFKNGIEDMKKADWYMKKYLELGGKVVKL